LQKKPKDAKWPPPHVMGNICKKFRASKVAPADSKNPDRQSLPSKLATERHLTANPSPLPPINDDSILDSLNSMNNGNGCPNNPPGDYFPMPEPKPYRKTHERGPKAEILNKETSILGTPDPTGPNSKFPEIKTKEKV
jgi:hypothetical protein